MGYCKSCQKSVVDDHWRTHEWRPKTVGERLAVWLGGGVYEEFPFQGLILVGYEISFCEGFWALLGKMINGFFESIFDGPGYRTSRMPLIGGILRIASWIIKGMMWLAFGLIIIVLGMIFSRPGEGFSLLGAILGILIAAAIFAAFVAIIMGIGVAVGWIARNACPIRFTSKT